MRPRLASRVGTIVFVLNAFALCAAAAGCDDGARAVDPPGGGGLTCPPPLSTVCPGPAPSFAATIVPLLDASCNGCHDPDIAGAPWPLRDYDDVRDWRDLIKPDLLTCSMPPKNSGITISDVDRQQILTWIACDTPNN